MNVIVVLLLTYQVFMPAVNNGHYQLAVDPTTGSIIRMNTQDGSVQRCDPTALKCAVVALPSLEKKPDDVTAPEQHHDD